MFRARMRLHQSWWRAAVLGVPCGTGPHPTSTTFRGNMLDGGAAASGLNFLTPAIHELFRQRLLRGGSIEPFRCARNLLSSQPMCFNLFGPLVRNLELATRLMGSLFRDEIESVTRIVIEYAPDPSSDYLGDRTAFDAFVAYRRPDGAEAFLGIETKLADTFSPTVYDTPRYRLLTERDPSPWRRSAWPRLSDGRWNQLWRNHVLVEAMRRHLSAPHGRLGRLVVVSHPGDKECAAVVDQYRELLNDAEPSFLHLRLDRLVDAWRAVAHGEDERRWLDAFHARYLHLDLSEAAWRAQGA